MSTPTLRTLAKQLGLSRATVSEALRGSPRVKATTAERVRAAAAAAGYQHNPLTEAVMSHIRRSSHLQFNASIAVVDMAQSDQPLHRMRYTAALIEGIKTGAAENGFRVEQFAIKSDGLNLQRLNTILHTRGINALILLPALGFPDFSGLDWNRYSAIYADYYIDHPPLHCVCSDHYRSMVTLLQELHHRGYRRPGLIMETATDSRIHFRLEGAFLALQHVLPDLHKVPVLRCDKLDSSAFKRWFKKHEPDVVLGHPIESLAWLRSCGTKPGESHGFVCLNLVRTDGECAALDLQPRLIGERATELVIGKLLRSQFGTPKQPSLTTIPSQLIEGPTLRPPR